MRRPEIVPFAEEHVEAAASLLAERQRAQRAVEPSLAARFESPAGTRPELERLLASDGASGAALLRGGVLAGFLLGAPRGDTTWGPNTWVEAPGHAVVEAELVRDLYAAAAARWVEEGRTSHYAIVPASDPALVDAWFRLGFGHQHVHAVREVPSTDESGTPDEVAVRRATRDDIPDLARLDVVLLAHQERSPVFSAMIRPTFEEARAEWESDFDEDRFATFVAEIGGAVVGSAIGCPLEASATHSGLAHVDRAAFLGFAAVDPAFRGRGAGGALLDAVYGWARETGYETIVADWRMTNLLASRMWTNRGFRPTFYRLFRAIA